MSWLFGLRKDPGTVGSVVPSPEGSGDDGNGQLPSSQQQRGAVGGTKSSEAYRFDSSALERAAQAAKDLEKSSNHFSCCSFSC